MAIDVRGVPTCTKSATSACLNCVTLLLFLDAHPGMDADCMLEAIQRGVARAEREFPMVVGLIGLLHHQSVETMRGGATGFWNEK